jgi:FixJ family two-component response regulator/two-component sensor histidine kinase
MEPFDHPTVFIVEDDAETRNSFCALACSIGVKAEGFASAEAFLEHVDLRRTGCAVVDFRLPGMNGIELQRRLLTARNDLPVILVSAFMDVRVAAEAVQQGVFRILQKPYPDSELSDAIQAAIQSERSQGKKRRYRLDVEHRLNQLDARERRTLELILDGQPNKSIGRRLALSRRTVERIRSRILDKMKTSTFVELATALGVSGIPESSDDAEADQPAGSATLAARSFPSSSPLPPLLPGERKLRLLCCDLHDGPSQYVSAAAMRLHTLQQTDLSPAAHQAIDEAALLVRRAQDEMRDLIAGRDSTHVRQLGLVPAIRTLIKDLSCNGQLDVELSENLGSDSPGTEQEIAVYRIIQEALNNALRHSGSQRVHIEVLRQNDEIHLRIRDWGRGFDPAADIHAHWGLRGVRQRVRLLNGTLAIESEPGRGTSLSAQIPVQSDSSESS